MYIKCEGWPWGARGAVKGAPWDRDPAHILIYIYIYIYTSVYPCIYMHGAQPNRIK